MSESEDTRAILHELGLDPAGIDALFECGAVGDERVYPHRADGDTVTDSPWAPKR